MPNLSISHLPAAGTLTGLEPVPLVFGGVTSQATAQQIATFTTSTVLMASENITAPALVNVWSNGGVFQVRNANGGTTGKEAHGFVLSSVGGGFNVTIYFVGVVRGLSTLTPGFAFLSTTPGGVTSTSPTAPGDTSQIVGVAISATAINFSPQLPIGL